MQNDAKLGLVAGVAGVVVAGVLFAQPQAPSAPPPPRAKTAAPASVSLPAPAAGMPNAPPMPLQ